MQQNSEHSGECATDALAEADTLRKENVELRERLESTLFSLKALTDELLDTRRKLDDAHERINEGIEVEKAVAMVERKLDEVDNMRRNYERRITELKTRLAAANERLRREAQSEIPPESPQIDMQKRDPAPDGALNPDGDWLQSLPD